MKPKNEFNVIKKRALEVARDLEYDKIVCRKIEDAQSEVQITNILAEARREL